MHHPVCLYPARAQTQSFWHARPALVPSHMPTLACFSSDPRLPPQSLGSAEVLLTSSPVRSLWASFSRMGLYPAGRSDCPQQLPTSATLTSSPTRQLRLNLVKGRALHHGKASFKSLTGDAHALPRTSPWSKMVSTLAWEYNTKGELAQPFVPLSPR